MVTVNPLLEKVNKVLGKDCTHRTYLETIVDLVKLVEQQQKEYQTLYSSIAEDDGMIEQLQKEIEQYKTQEELLLERLKKQSLQIKEMKNNSRLINFHQMAEENLKMAQEVARLKGELPV